MCTNSSSREGMKWLLLWLLIKDGVDVWNNSRGTFIDCQLYETCPARMAPLQWVAVNNGKYVPLPKHWLWFWAMAHSWEGEGPACYWPALKEHLNAKCAHVVKSQVKLFLQGLVIIWSYVEWLSVSHSHIEFYALPSWSELRSNFVFSLHLLHSVTL